MKKLRQSDPQWAKITIRKTSFTLGRWGCTIVSISMLSDYFGCFHWPTWLAKQLRFTSKGLILWDSVGEKLCFKKVERFYGNQQDKIYKAVYGSPDTACILEVNNNHWVVALGRIPFTKTWRIADPITGTIATTLRYRNNITGGATFKIA